MKKQDSGPAKKPVEETANKQAKIGSVEIEALAHNVARLVEEGGKALAAYMKPREEGKIKSEAAEDIADMVKTIGQILEYWLSDPERALQLQTSLGRAFLDLYAVAAKRMAGEEAKPAAAPDPKDKRFTDPDWSKNQFFDFLKQLYLLAVQWAEKLVRDAAGRRAHAGEGRLLHQADRQRDRAVEFRLHQPRAAARDVRFEGGKPGARHAHAHRGHQSRARLSQDHAIGARRLRGRPQPRAHSRQGDLPERINPAPAIRGHHAGRAQDPAADRAALDQQVLHPRSDAGKILHQMVRRQRAHRVRGVLGQSGRQARQEKLRAIHARGRARRARRRRGSHRREADPHHRLLRRRHAVGDHARLSRDQTGQPRHLCHAVHRAGRFHLCRRSQGLRRRGAHRAAGSAHAGARLSRGRPHGDRLQHAALQRSGLALRHQQLHARQEAVPVRHSLLEFRRHPHAGGESLVLSAQLLSRQHAGQGQDDSSPARRSISRR